jgi:hypothetical protein
LELENLNNKDITHSISGYGGLDAKAFYYLSSRLSILERKGLQEDIVKYIEKLIELQKQKINLDDFKRREEEFKKQQWERKVTELIQKGHTFLANEFYDDGRKKALPRLSKYFSREYGQDIKSVTVKGNKLTLTQNEIIFVIQQFKNGYNEQGKWVQIPQPDKIETRKVKKEKLFEILEDFIVEEKQPQLQTA